MKFFYKNKIHGVRSIGVMGALFVCLMASLPSWSRDDWKVYHSVDGFSVKYPSAWNRLSTDKRELSIISGKARVQGNVIEPNESWITVHKVMFLVEDSYLNFLKKRFPYEEIHGEIIQNSHKSEFSCQNIEKIEYKSEVAPNFYMVYTFFYCKIMNENFETLITHWDGDLTAEHDLQVSLKMMKSLRKK